MDNLAIDKPVQHKKIWVKLLLIALILILAIGGVLYWANQKKHTNPASSKQEAKAVYKPQKEVAVTSVPGNQLPAGLPSDLPIQSTDSEVVRNIEANSGNDTQSTRTYISKKPIEEIAKDYTEYYVSHGWSPDPIFKTKDNWGVSASKDKSLLNVALIPRSDGTVMVSITLTKK